MKNSIFIPLVDNGLGISRTGWGMSMFALGLSDVLRGRKIEIQAISYPYPSGAMNVASNDFLASGCEEMLIIDTDLRFEPEHVAMLLSHDVPLVAGLYPKKQVGCNFPMAFLDPNQKTFTDDPEPLVEVACIARGFMRIHRSVFERLYDYSADYIDPDSKKSTRNFGVFAREVTAKILSFAQIIARLAGKFLWISASASSTKDQPFIQSRAHIDYVRS